MEGGRPPRFWRESGVSYAIVHNSVQRSLSIGVVSI